MTNKGYVLPVDEVRCLGLLTPLEWEKSDADAELGGDVTEVPFVRTEREELVDNAEGVDEFEERSEADAVS